MTREEELRGTWCATCFHNDVCMSAEEGPQPELDGPCCLMYERKIKIAYICDKTRCNNSCGEHPDYHCQRTLDIDHAVNFQKVADGVYEERPQNKWGKWVISEVRCPECLEYFDTDCYSKEEMNKCPNCGADMRKEGEVE